MQCSNGGETDFSYTAEFALRKLLKINWAFSQREPSARAIAGAGGAAGATGRVARYRPWAARAAAVALQRAQVGCSMLRGASGVSRCFRRVWAALGVQVGDAGQSDRLDEAEWRSARGKARARAHIWRRKRPTIGAREGVSVREGGPLHGRKGATLQYTSQD